MAWNCQEEKKSNFYIHSDQLWWAEEHLRMRKTLTFDMDVPIMISTSLSQEQECEAIMGKDS